MQSEVQGYRKAGSGRGKYSVTKNNTEVAFKGTDTPRYAQDSFLLNYKERLHRRVKGAG